MHLRDDAESPEAADLKLGQIVSRHILHHLPTGIDQAAVSGGNAAPEDVTPHRPEAMAQRAGRCRSHHRSDTSLRPAGWIEGEPHAVVGEAAAKRLEGRSCL